MKLLRLAALAALPLLAGAGPSADGTDAALARGLAGLPEALVSVHHRAVARWGMGMYETSASGFEQILKSEPDQPAVLANLAAVRLLQRRPAPAAALLDRALARLPGSPRLLYLRGRAARLQDDDARAVELLRKAAAGDPGEPAFALALAESLAATGRPGDAETELRRLLRVRPGHGPALFRLARLLEARGERVESEKLLKRFAAADGRPAAARSPYDAPLEPPVSAPEAGDDWIEVRAVRSRKDKPAVVSVFSGRLAVRADAADKPVRLKVGRRGPLDAVRVDWADGTHSYRLDVSTGATIVVEEAASHVW